MMCIKERNTSDSTCKKLLRDEGCFADLCNYAFFSRKTDHSTRRTCFKRK